MDLARMSIEQIARAAKDGKVSLLAAAHEVERRRRLHADREAERFPDIQRMAHR